MPASGIRLTPWRSTGARRHRTEMLRFGWHGRRPVVLLQIEEVSLWNGHLTGNRNEYRWRDATPDDLLQALDREPGNNRN